MKMYKKPIAEVELLNGISMLMNNTTSPSGDIQGNPDGGLNGPNGKNAPARPF